MSALFRRLPCVLPLGPLLLAAPLLAQATTERVSVSSSGAEGDLHCGPASASYDGRFVAFESRAATLVGGDTNGSDDIFVRDRLNGTTERVSVSSNGAQADGYSLGPSISADGRYVAFESSATNLVAGDTNGARDVFVRDRWNGITLRVSVDSSGAEADGASRSAALSSDGRFVAFASDATNLVPGDTNSVRDIFVRDLQAGTTERVSVSSAGAQANQFCHDPVLSADGRFVAFDGLASTLVLGDVGGFSDVFVRDRLLGTTERASLDSSGAQAQGGSMLPSLSADGRFVAFESIAANLVPGDTNQSADIFVHDRLSGATERVSLSSAGAGGDDDSHAPSISADGRCVAFESFAANLVAGDTNVHSDVFLRDRLAGTTERLSVDTAGAQGDGESLVARLAPGGRALAFLSLASNLVAGDTNGFADVFVRDLGAEIPGSDLCQPGSGGVGACPCANPPANAPRGCDNSSATGGAQLGSTGTASLAFDSAVFLTNGETPSATSVLLQGDAQIAGGAVFGQGLRCAGGLLKRLYVKHASAGSIRAPEAGDPSLSARSAALGDPIAAGTSRWYAVYYRDPIVLGGCPAGSTFNVTQTQLLGWNP